MRRRTRWAATAVAVLTVLTGLAYAAGGAGASTAHPAATAPAPVPHPLAAEHMPAGLPHTHLPEHVTSPANGTLESSNWSGYLAVACTTCHLRYAETQFTIPSVNCADSTLGSSGYAYVAHWAGLDGWTNGTVEQTGVDAYCTSTSSPAGYYAWYEMYPLDPVTFSGVSPGDAIEADVYYNGSGYQLHLLDITTGGYIFTTQPCPVSSCQHTNAEVITEDPGGAVAGGYDLADFGQSNYLGSQVTSLAGIHGNYVANGYWNPYAVTMLNGYTVMAAPGPVEGGAAFPDVWKSSQ